jgi:hypothetical protein
VALSAALYINCTVGLKCLNTAQLVARCSVAVQLNVYSNKRGQLLGAEGRHFIGLLSAAGGHFIALLSAEGRHFIGLLSAEGRHFIGLPPTVILFGEIRGCLVEYS